MRIALAGAGGTGKGTLGSALAKHYNIPFIVSHISVTGEMMGMNNYMDVKTQEKALSFQYSIMLGQIYQERALQEAGISYVAERSVYDYIPYFLEKNLNDQTYLDIIYNWGKSNYDAIFYLPVEFEPADKDTNEWKERDHDKRIKTGDCIYKYMESKYDTSKMLTVTGSLEERLQTIKLFVSKNKIA